MPLLYTVRLHSSIKVEKILRFGGSHLFCKEGVEQLVLIKFPHFDTLVEYYEGMLDPPSETSPPPL